MYDFRVYVPEFVRRAGYTGNYSSWEEILGRHPEAVFVVDMGSKEPVNPDEVPGWQKPRMFLTDIVADPISELDSIPVNSFVEIPRSLTLLGIDPDDPEFTNRQLSNDGLTWEADYRGVHYKSTFSGYDSESYFIVTLGPKVATSKVRSYNFWRARDVADLLAYAATLK